MATQSRRPKAGLGLSSAINREQLTTRNAPAAKSAKAPPIKSRAAKRAPPPKK